MFQRAVMIGGGVYRCHECRTVSVNEGGTTVYIDSWATESDMKNHAKSPLARAFHMDGSEETAGQSLLDAEVWAVGEGLFPEYTDPLDEVLPLLTDEQAEQVPDAFPQWESGIAYAVDWRVRFNGVLYKCIQAHTSQDGWEPPVAASLWVRIGEPGEIPEWVQPTGAHDAYAKGDKVRHIGKIWRSLVDANVWEPGAPGTESLWAEE